MVCGSYYYANWCVANIVLAREDVTNQVGGRYFQNKTTSAVCKFLLEDEIFRYGCVIIQFCATMNFFGIAFVVSV